MKIIFHLDLDSYFVAAERTINPDLNNKAVVISSGGRRSIVTAASYEAKKHGIKVGSPLYLAQQLMPQLMIVKPNFALYVHLASQVFELISQNFTNQIEVASIDECYLEATEIARQYHGAFPAAKALQDQILAKLNLPVSIGISANKFVAKMSTQLNKPLGITLTAPDDFLKVFGSWPIETYHGIGPGLAPRLRALGISKIQDLAHATPATLKPILGKNTSAYIKRAQGQDHATIDPKMNELKSIGNSITFQDYDKNQDREIYEILSHLCHMVAIRSKNRNVVGKVIALAIKEKGGQEIKAQSKQTTLVVPIQSYEDIYKEAKVLLQKIWKGTTIKFIGITISKLENILDTTYQMHMDEKSQESHQETIVKEINQKFKHKVTYLGKEQFLKNNKKQHQTRYLEVDKMLKHYDKK